MAPKMPPGKVSTSQVQVATNIYGLQMVSQKAIYRYQVKMVGEFPAVVEGQRRRDKPLEFTGQVRGE